MVLVFGEAGIGKSSLVDAVRAQLPAEGRMLVGYCDDLATPRTLGPFRDLVGRVGAELSRAVTGRRRPGPAAGRAARRAGLAEHPAVLVVEDVHWADDATLDALRFLVRRIADLPAVLILTYRDEELHREHLTPRPARPGVPARPGAAAATGPAVPGAVQRLSADSAVGTRPGCTRSRRATRSSCTSCWCPRTAAGCRRRSPTRSWPGSGSWIRAPRTCSSSSRWCRPGWTAGWRKALASPGATAALGLAEQRGLLTVSAQRISFRHELTRRAVEGAVRPPG